MDTQLIHVLRFLVQEVKICIELDMISKIFLLPTITKIPESSSYMVGMVNIHGKSVPIIDLTLRLNLERINPYSLDTAIILCQTGNREIGIIVDKILDIKKFTKDIIQIDNTCLDDDNLYRGTVTLDSELYLILNTNTIMNTYQVGKQEVVYEQNT